MSTSGAACQHDAALDVNIDLEFGNLLSELATLGCILATLRPFLATLDVKFGNPVPNSGNPRRLLMLDP